MLLSEKYFRKYIHPSIEGKFVALATIEEIKAYGNICMWEGKLSTESSKQLIKLIKTQLETLKEQYAL